MLTRSAIERQLIVISEAAMRLTAISERTGWPLPEGVEWSGVRGIGNLLRHRYDDIHLPILLDIAQNKLQRLRERCADASRTLGSTP